MASNVVARRCAMFFFALSVCVAGARYITEAHAAGAFAVGKCGAYGQAYDYGHEHEESWPRKFGQ
ncbi:inosine/xanthosine triphosphate pyrophosphatase family protein [Bradyrhizobium liaoningense]